MVPINILIGSTRRQNIYEKLGRSLLLILQKHVDGGHLYLILQTDFTKIELDTV